MLRDLEISFGEIQAILRCIYTERDGTQAPGQKELLSQTENEH